MLAADDDGAGDGVRFRENSRENNPRFLGDGEAGARIGW